MIAQFYLSMVLHLRDPFQETPGGALHCQVEHHVQTNKIYFVLKTSPKWVKLLLIVFHE